MLRVCSLFCLLSGLLLPIGAVHAFSAVATKAEVEQDGFLRSTAEDLKRSDVVLVVALYKSVKSDKGSVLYGRVVQSLRGDVPLEALVKWSSPNNRQAEGKEAEIRLYSECCLVYVLATSDAMVKLQGQKKGFAPAGDVSGCYDLGSIVGYFPRTESNPGRAMQRLLRIEDARIAEESEAAKFRKEE